jgi:hypothetical protein
VELNELKSIFDAKPLELEVLNYKCDDAVTVALQLFEKKLTRLKDINYLHPIWQRERIYDLQESLALILEWLYRYSDSTCTQTTSGQKYFSMLEEAFDLAYQFLNLEISVKSTSQGLMKEVLKEPENKTIYIEFSSPDVAYFEAVNEILLTNYNYQKFIKMPNFSVREIASIGIYAATTIKNRMHRKLDIEFELPDEYIIGPYSIKQIKEIWAVVMTKAFMEMMENLKRRKYTPTLMALLEMEKFRYKYSSSVEVNGLLNDLTYVGNYQKKNTKGKPIYSNFLTEPIVNVNGKKLISPSIILNYQVSRNILSTLNRIYGDDSHKQKGEQFTKELLAHIESYPDLLYAQEVPIKKPTQTDVDFALFDRRTETLLFFEIKWFNEPVTPVEIKSKDDELEKATTKQLPNCYKGKLHNPTEFIQKAFGVKLSDPTTLNLQGYVLTRLTVGSGNINRNNFEVINHNMLLKALKDCNGELPVVKELLNKRAYYPLENADFNFGSVRNEVGEYTLSRDGYSLLLP